MQDYDIRPERTHDPSMTNGKHRARWLADIISEVQRYHSKAREAPESAAVRQALSRLAEARQAARIWQIAGRYSR